VKEKADAIRQFVSERIGKLAADKGKSVEIGDDFSLLESGLIDSLGFVDLVTDIEDTFDVEMDFGDLDPEEFTRLGGLVQCAVSADSVVEGERS